jgi:hypothetical protein
MSHSVCGVTDVLLLPRISSCGCGSMWDASSSVSPVMSLRASFVIHWVTFDALPMSY